MTGHPQLTTHLITIDQGVDIEWPGSQIFLVLTHDGIDHRWPYFSFPRRQKDDISIPHILLTSHTCASHFLRRIVRFAGRKSTPSQF
jgi:hypothetical protein